MLKEQILFAIGLLVQLVGFVADIVKIREANMTLPWRRPKNPTEAQASASHISPWRMAIRLVAFVATALGFYYVFIGIDRPDFRRSSVQLFSVGIAEDKATGITVMLTLRNTGTAGAVEDYKMFLEMHPSGGTEEGQIVLPRGGGLSLTNQDDKPTWRIPPEYILTNRPPELIQRGGMMRGALVATFHGIQQSDAMRAGNRIIVTFSDAYGRTYTASETIHGKWAQ